MFSIDSNIYSLKSYKNRGRVWVEAETADIDWPWTGSGPDEVAAGRG